MSISRTLRAFLVATVLALPAVQLHALPDCPGANPQDGWRQGTLNDTARILAGLRAPLESELAKVVDEAALRRHRDTLGASWAELRRRQLEPAAAFARAELGAAETSPKRVYYPFSGPDALYLLTMFPDVQASILTGLEPVGSVPDFSGLDARAIEAGLAEIRHSLYAILSFSFFRTNDLTVDLRRSRFGGVTPILFVFLAEAGYAVYDVRYVLLPPDGTLCRADASMLAKPPRGHLSGVEVEYFDPEDFGFRRMLYLSADLGDGALQRTPQYLDHVARFDPDATYLKSASYLMYRSWFSQVRKLILEHSEVVLQDDSGIPHAWFRAPLWEATLYGRYGSPIPLFANWQQPGLRAAYADGKPKALEFGIGYRHRRNDSNLQIYRKRPQEHASP
ncbi:MAG: hypothetical protein IT479_02955 [Xanthomonadales bacterium]|nr:hypothetical protein [Xanthomonadales bacterium]MCC6592210.1 hypothetical protein [Xanthomonadales bacterium]MCE7931610.1 hypothetical protein [Xanthomonadales bacterium PRO6]